MSVVVGGWWLEGELGGVKVLQRVKGASWPSQAAVSRAPEQISVPVLFHCENV